MSAKLKANQKAALMEFYLAAPSAGPLVGTKATKALQWDSSLAEQRVAEKGDLTELLKVAWMAVEMVARKAAKKESRTVEM